MKGPGVFINSIQTAVPPTEGHDWFCEILFSVIANPHMAKIAREIYQYLPVKTRHSVIPEELWYPDNPGAFYRKGHFPKIGARMKVYQEEALPLASLAIEPLFHEVKPQDITHLIVTTSTGFYGPGVDHDIVEKFGLNPTVSRTLIGFMECYAGVTALRQAYDIVKSQPEAKVLIINLELCTLHWKESAPLDQIIAFMLFADGCAASLVSSEPRGLCLESFFGMVTKGTSDYLQLHIEDDAFTMAMSSKIPESIRGAVQSHKEQIFHGYSIEDIKLWAIHPGGPAIVEKVQSALGIPHESVEPSLAVLREYGNMSSPTIMFILKKLLEDPHLSGLGCCMAFGPGLTLESFLFNKLNDVAPGILTDL